MNTSTLYKSPVLKEVEINFTLCINSSPYGDAGNAGNYDSNEDNDYTDIDF